MLKLRTVGVVARAYSTTLPLTEFNKTEENGIAHVTSINAISGDKSIVQLSKVQSDTQNIKRLKREYHLPQEAVVALRQTLVNSKHTPKQLQHAADQIFEKLAQRRFPVSSEIVKKSRDQIKRRLLKETKDEDFDDILGDEKIREAQDYELRNKVDKLLKKSKYNWKPLEFDTRESTIAYTLARLVPNFAEISRCLEELPNSELNSVLDFGSGSGAAFWAVRERFPAFKDITLVDTCDIMTKTAMDTMRDENGELIDRRVQFRRNILPSLNTTYDLVIGHRFLSEFGSFQTRMQTVEALWARTNKYLVLIESSLQDSFEALLDVRDHFLIAGMKIDKDALEKILKDQGLYSNAFKEIIRSRNLSYLERFDLLREMLPLSVRIPTELPTASVVAPCPHDLGCALRGRESCSFDIRWKPIRADGKHGRRERDGTETGKFSFVILKKEYRQSGENIGRILKMRKMNAHLTCDVCTAFCGVQRLTVSKRAGPLYDAVRKRRAGELFPLSTRTKATENTFDLYEYGKSAAKVD